MFAGKRLCFRKETAEDRANQEYKDYKRKMQTVAESRANMRIDLRPQVVAKTMTKELFLIFLSLSAVVSRLVSPLK